MARLQRHSTVETRVYAFAPCSRRLAPRRSSRAPRRGWLLMAACLAALACGWLAALSPAAAREQSGLDVDSVDSELLIWADDLAWAGEELHVAVEPQYSVTAIYVSLPHVSSSRVRLRLNQLTGLYEGVIRVPLELDTDQLTVRVQTRDHKSRPQQTEFILPVLFDGC